MTSEEALRHSARRIHCKAEYGVVRARTSRAVLHRVGWIKAACDGDRIRYYARWQCGFSSHDVTLIADPAPFSSTCEHCESLAQGAFVYRCYDAAGRLLYIGHGSCRWCRFHSHHSKKSWWPEVTRVDLVEQPDVETARKTEALAIKAEGPVHNKQHNRRPAAAAMSP